MFVFNSLAHADGSLKPPIEGKEGKEEKGDDSEGRETLYCFNFVVSSIE